MNNFNLLLDSFICSSFIQDSALKYWRLQGAPAEKLLMGFATYGRSFILTSSQSGVGAPANNLASPGPYTHEMGLWAYFEVNRIGKYIFLDRNLCSIFFILIANACLY